MKAEIIHDELIIISESTTEDYNLRMWLLQNKNNKTAKMTLLNNSKSIIS